MELESGLRAAFSSVVYDAVTLRHFASIERLDVLRTFAEGCPRPFWTEGVHAEIHAGRHQAECSTVLSAAWLGPAYELELSDFARAHGLQVALGNGLEPATQNRGEAESILLADKQHGVFITDDNVAHDFAERMLGVERVWDSIDVLRFSVGRGSISADDAVLQVNAMRNVGRHLRRPHPMTITKAYFL